MFLWERDEEFIELGAMKRLVMECRNVEKARLELKKAADLLACDATDIARIQALIKNNPELNDREIAQLYINQINHEEFLKEQEDNQITATQMLQDRIEYEKEQIKIKAISRMLKKQYDYEEIAEFIDVSVDFVKEVEKEMEAGVHDITYER